MTKTKSTWLWFSAIVLLITVCVIAYCWEHNQPTDAQSAVGDKKSTEDTSTPAFKIAQLTRPASTAHSQNVLPAENAPLSDTFKELVRLSNSGNATASMRLFRDLQKCRSRLVSESRLNAIYYRLPGQTDAEYKQWIMRESQHEPAILKALNQLDSTDTLCNGISDKIIWNSGLFLRQAALQNDPEAMVCYASSYELGQPKMFSDAWFDYAAQWKQDAPYVAQEALNAGQPGILKPLIEATLPRDPNDMYAFSLHEVVKSNPQIAYALALLYNRLVNEADHSNGKYDLAKLSSRLTPNQLADAQASADALWPRFQDANDNGASLVPCKEFLSWPMDSIGSPEAQ